DVEQLGQLGIVHQPRLGEPAVRQPAALGQCDQFLDVRAKLLRLGGGGGDLLVLDQRGRHVAEQGRTVARGALKLTMANAVAHGSILSFVWGPYEVSPARRFSGGPPLPPKQSGERCGPPVARSQAESAWLVKDFAPGNRLPYRISIKFLLLIGMHYI